MRDYAKELRLRAEWIRGVLRRAGADGIVYGNSGGKDSTLVGILCRQACDNTLGVILPCQSGRNYGEDREDAIAAAEQYGIATAEVDLSEVKEALLRAVQPVAIMERPANANISPRLRMTALYALAQSRNSLVAGTGNRSESYVGYFTKWGDGACDFNPIADLTVSEIYEFLRYLKAPAHILEKAPSAGLYKGQADEREMGVSYRAIDNYLIKGTGKERELDRIRALHEKSLHKRQPIPVFAGAEGGDQR